MARQLTYIFALTLLSGNVVRAQDAAATRQAGAVGAPDFFFGQPRASVGVRGSWVFARAGSDVFDFVSRTLTLEKSDFNAPAFGFDVGVPITSRVEARFDLELTQSTSDSEYRDYVDNQLLPITQTTRLLTRGLSGNVRFNLTPRGRSVSRYAWVPKGLTPYVGAGAGTVWYSFEQTGDFVDFVDLSVFNDFFAARGWAPNAYVFGGADLHLYRVMFLTLEGRYLWAKGNLGADFIDFEPIDLAGFRASTGLSLVF